MTAFVFSKRVVCSLLRPRVVNVGQATKMNHIKEEVTNHILSNSQQKRHFTVAVEGNIASGKTCLLEYYNKKASCGLEVLKEPVDRWCNINGHNALGLLYENPERWSMLLQSYVQLTLAEISTTPQTKPVRMLERTIFSARYCFVENLYHSGKMSEVEYCVLSEWFKWLTTHCNFKLDLIVYLQTSPETVYERIKKRGRKEEMSIPLSYLESLHELHEDWLIRRTNSSWELPAPVLVLDANKDLDTMVSVYEEHQNKILHSFTA